MKLHPSVENHERTLLIVSRLVVTYMDVESDRKAYDLYSCIGHSVAMLKANCIADIVKADILEREIESPCCSITVQGVHVQGIVLDVEELLFEFSDSHF